MEHDTVLAIIVMAFIACGYIWLQIKKRRKK
jgi:hypothetical protein